jgi:hypothetical protein
LFLGQIILVQIGVLDWFVVGNSVAKGH